MTKRVAHLCVNGLMVLALCLSYLPAAVEAEPPLLGTVAPADSAIEQSVELSPALGLELPHN